MDYEFVPGRDDFPPDEIGQLRRQLNDADEALIAVERALKDVDYRGTYADGVLYLKQQLSAVLAAIEVKDIALNELTDLMCESYGITGFHLNGDVAPWSEVEEGGRFERLTSLNDALATKPDASALKAHDITVFRKGAEYAFRATGSNEGLTVTDEEAISELTNTLP